MDSDISTPLDGGAVTLIEGFTFCIGARSGDLGPEAIQGLFHRDTRILAEWQLRIQGRVPQPVMVLREQPGRATFVARVLIGESRTEALIERTRSVGGGGMREEIRLRNLGQQPIRTTLQIRIRSDFADVLAVKEGRPRPRGPISTRPRRTWLDIQREVDGTRQGVRIGGAGAVAHREGLHFEVCVPPAGEWRTTVTVSWSAEPSDLEQQASDSPGPAPIGLGPAPIGFEPVGPGELLDRSRQDLAALRIVDPQDPAAATVAAGVPWLMALFGRDSLLSGYMALPLNPALAIGTLQVLARRQGTRVDPRTDEEPGRILHETRLDAEVPLARGGGPVYYGTVDATPLFVILLGELDRSEVAPAVVADLLPNADRALDWIEQYGDRDGDGFVEYRRRADSGLLHQGWKDSPDGITFADGRPALAPIALAEVQGYVYAAYRFRARLARTMGDVERADRLETRAARLKVAFNQRFWLPERGWFALGLDVGKRPIDALASNVGHCLWAGLIDEDKAEAVAERLLSPEMFSGWGVRTLASTMCAYNPMGYHRGSVWPHDNALIATGLLRYGFGLQARRIAQGMLDAATAFGGRLPEFFGGFDRFDYPVPVPHPTACAPQAAAAASIHLLTAVFNESSGPGVCNEPSGRGVLNEPSDRGSGSGLGRRVGGPG